MVPDEQSSNCTLCNASFSIFNRRHHCRLCGILVCNNCSKHRMRVGGKQEPQRVCTRCVEKVSAHRASQSGQAAPGMPPKKSRADLPGNMPRPELRMSSTSVASATGASTNGSISSQSSASANTLAPPVMLSQAQASAVSGGSASSSSPAVVVSHEPFEVATRGSGMSITARSDAGDFQIVNGVPKAVEALYDYTAQESNELSFHAFDVISISGELDENWWFGELNGQKGAVPKMYVAVPGKKQRLRAIAEYEAKRPEELSLARGDFIIMLIKVRALLPAGLIRVGTSRESVCPPTAAAANGRLGQRENHRLQQARLVPSQSHGACTVQ